MLWDAERYSTSTARTKGLGTLHWDYLSEPSANSLEAPNSNNFFTFFDGGSDFWNESKSCSESSLANQMNDQTRGFKSRMQDLKRGSAMKTTNVLSLGDSNSGSKSVGKSQVLHGTLRGVACAQEPHFEKHVHREVTLPKKILVPWFLVPPGIWEITHTHTSRVLLHLDSYKFPHIHKARWESPKARPFVRVGQTIAQGPNLAHQPTAYFGK